MKLFARNIFPMKLISRNIMTRLFKLDNRSITYTQQRARATRAKGAVLAAGSLTRSRREAGRRLRTAGDNAERRIK